VYQFANRILIYMKSHLWIGYSLIDSLLHPLGILSHCRGAIKSTIIEQRRGEAYVINRG